MWTIFFQKPTVNNLYHNEIRISRSNYLEKIGRGIVDAHDCLLLWLHYIQYWSWQYVQPFMCDRNGKRLDFSHSLIVETKMVWVGFLTIRRSFCPGTLFIKINWVHHHTHSKHCIWYWNAKQIDDQRKQHKSDGSPYARVLQYNRGQGVEWPL